MNSKPTCIGLALSLITLSACNIGNSHNSLMRKSCGGMMHYTQERNPNPDEVKNGLEALRKWKDANPTKRNELADLIVLGKSLNGLTLDQAVNYLGPPDGQFRYKTKGYEQQCDLVFEFGGDSRIQRAYIDATN
jgi:hypothetical protein